MVNFENEVDFKADFDLEKIANLVCDTILTEEGCPYLCEIDLLITDADSVREINKEFRDIDNTTDVLSFPNVDWTSPSDYECESFNDDLLVNPDTELIMLGQIILNNDRIVSQAAEYGHSVKREYAFLIAHSMLHLLGYDHIDDEERKAMENKQSKYLEMIGIKR